MSSERETRRIGKAIFEALQSPPTPEEAGLDRPDEYDAHKGSLLQDIGKVSQENELIGSALFSLLYAVDINHEIQTGFLRQSENNRKDFLNELRSCLDDVVQNRPDMLAKELVESVGIILFQHVENIDSLINRQQRFGGWTGTGY